MKLAFRSYLWNRFRFKKAPFPFLSSSTPSSSSSLDCDPNPWPSQTIEPFNLKLLLGAKVNGNWFKRKFLFHSLFLYLSLFRVDILFLVLSPAISLQDNFARFLALAYVWDTIIADFFYNQGPPAPHTAPKTCSLRNKVLWSIYEVVVVHVSLLFIWIDAKSWES